MDELQGPGYELSRDFSFFVRNQTLAEKKKTLEDKFPQNEGAWASFRFIYNNFKQIRSFNNKFQSLNLAPTLEYADHYLNKTFPNDSHLETMKNKQKIMIVTYLAMYEKLIPVIYKDTNLTLEEVASRSYFPSAY
jgi:hypothetical protein